MGSFLAAAEERLLGWVKRNRILAVLLLAGIGSGIWLEHHHITPVLQWFRQNGELSTLAGFLAVWWQLRSQQRTIASQTQWRVYDSGLKTLSTFVEHPTLRPYFYGNKDDDGMTEVVPLPADPIERHRVLAAAEVLCDHWEATALSEQDLAAAQVVNSMWARYMQDVYQRSPSLQYFLRDDVEGLRYSEEFKTLVSHRPAASSGAKGSLFARSVAAQGVDDGAVQGAGGAAR